MALKASRKSRQVSRRTYVVTALVIAGLLIAGAEVARRTFLGEEAPRRLPDDRSEAILYVALGDSTVYGVGAEAPENNYVSRLYERLRGVYPRARLMNLGVSGATAADVAQAQLRSAVAQRPDLVTLSVGPNDITRGRDAREYERDIETILATLARETAAVIVVNLIPDLAVTPRFRGREVSLSIGRRVTLFNDALTSHARAHNAAVVDLYTPSQREVPQQPQLIAADGYHPSDQGYARWAELMWRGVEARMARD